MGWDGGCDGMGWIVHVVRCLFHFTLKKWTVMYHATEIIELLDIRKVDR